MPRIRRKPEEARTAILDAAEKLLLEEGLAGLKLAKVAKVVGISHPGVLHHFGSADGLLEAVHQRISLALRHSVIDAIVSPKTDMETNQLTAILDTLGNQRTGQLLACLVAAGLDPFPPAEEKGMKQVIDHVHRTVENSGTPYEDTEFTVQLALLAMLGDAILGNNVRARMDVPNLESATVQFRQKLQQLLVDRLNTKS